jgi:hypothetical protein
MDSALAELVKTAMIAVVGSRITKSMGEKDISDIISCAGMAAVGICSLEVLLPVVRSLQELGANMQKFFDTFSGITESLAKSGTWIGDWIQRGMVR